MSSRCRLWCFWAAHSLPLRASVFRVLTGTHRCALMPRVASRQSANPFVAGVVLKSCGHGRGERCVVVNILSDVGTETTRNPCSTGSAARKFSVVTTRTIHDSRSKFPCERLCSQCFVSSSMFVLGLSTVQALCDVASVVLELLLDVIHRLAFLHDVLQHGRVFVETCP